MPSIRKTNTASGATAVQVVRYQNRKLVVLKHVGSAVTKTELATLMKRAEVWIDEHLPQRSFLPYISESKRILEQCQYLGVRYTFAHSILSALIERMGFMSLNDVLLLDLVIMRLVEPVSKLRSIALLERYFNRSYSERSLYRALPLFAEQKDLAEKTSVAFAKRELSDALTLVLYDVTTLYFETFEADDFRKPGFSKDNKSNQPQIVLGLLVNGQGFPLGYELFEGNTFEGKTMLPVLEAFQLAHEVKTCTVVADAAMMALQNTVELKAHGFSYIVGARLANASAKTLKDLSLALGKKDGATTRIKTDHGDLVCGFSNKRFRKDKFEMDKHVEKAKGLVERREPGKRAKFVQSANEGDYALNEALMKKTELLLGIKGYYTNIPQEIMADIDIIAHYHDLWHVEQSFRMTKSDLLARPIFHHKKDSIRAHLVICFIALSIGKYLEIATNQSIRHFMDLLWSVTDAQIIDTVTNEVLTLRSPVSDELKDLLKKIRVSY